MKVKNRGFANTLGRHIYKYGDILFITLLFSLTLFELPYLEVYLNTKEVSFVLVLSIWGAFKTFTLRRASFKIGFKAILVTVLFLFLLVHFIFFSEAGIYYSRFWIFLYGFLAFFLFRRLFDSGNRLKFQSVLIVLVFLSFLQAMFGLLQYAGPIKSNNEFFIVVGSFPSPNYLGLYLTFGLTILLWHFSREKFRKNWKTTVGIPVFLLMIAVLVLTDSRGSWIAFLSAVLLLGCTSKKSREIAHSFSTVKKVIIGFVFFLSISVFGYFLYTLNEESVAGRFLIAKITSEEIAKKPMLGHGLFSFAKGYNMAKVAYFSHERDWKEVKVANYVTTAFNDYLLMAYELGIPFLLVFLFGMALLFFKVQITPETRIGMALLMSIAVWSLFNSIFSTPAFVLIAFLGLAILVEFQPKSRILIKFSKRQSRLLLIGVLWVFCVTGVILSTIKFYAAHKIEKKPTGIEWRGNDPLGKLTVLSRFLDNNRTSDFNIGNILMRLGFKEEGFRFMESSFEKTMKPAIGRKLAAHYLEEGNFIRANEIYTLNMGLEPFRYEPIADLIEIQENVNNYPKVISLSQKVVDMPVKMSSKRVDEHKKIAKKRIAYHTGHSNTSQELKGTLSKTLFFKSDVLRKKLIYKVYLPPLAMITEKLPIVYINDGRAYTKNGTVHILDSLMAIGKIRPAAAIFLEPKDGYQNYKNVRQELFLCNTDFADFFAEEFIPQVEYKYPIGGDRTKRTIMGRSFGGLASAFVANTKPKLFKNIVMQSPAFHPCPEIYNMFPQSTVGDFTIYLSYGTGKDTERQGLKMKTDLTKKGYDFELDIVENGNHDWHLWRPQLKDIFTFLYAD